MDSAVGAETEEMEFLAAGLDIVVDLGNLLVLLKLVLLAGHIDFDEILIDNASCAEVHVSDLRVAHLSVRQTDVFAAGLEMAVGIFCTQAVDERLALGVNRIAVVVASFAPTVENHQKYFSIHI